MKRIFTFLFLSVLIFSNLEISAQTKFSVSDLESYMNAYAEPFANALPVGLGGGWAHTAKVHSTLGFDITFSASVVQIPDVDGTVSTSNIKLPSILSFDDGVNSVPTLSGDKMDYPPNLIATLTPVSGVALEMPVPTFNGTGINFSGMASIQAGVGLPKGTELIVRFIPDISKVVNNRISDGTGASLEKTGMWGVGVKHDIKQWIPVIAKVPFLQISGLFTYSKMYTGFAGSELTISPEKINDLSNTIDITSKYAASTWDDQSFKMKMSSFTGNLLVGANIPVFQPYIGVGFNAGTFESGLYGTYPVFEIYDHDNNPSTPDEIGATDKETDPLIIKTKTSSINFQVGARLKLGPIVFFGQWTKQKYSMYTGGLAVTIR